MLPKRRKRQRTKPLPDRVRCPSHLQWVRSRYFCCVPTTSLVVQADDRIPCSEGTEAAHVRLGTDGAMGVKPGDCYVVPLCPAHHAQQHRIGEATFWALYRADPYKIAAKLWAVSPAGKKYRAEQRENAG